jgi:hypothetical protein
VLKGTGTDAAGDALLTLGSKMMLQLPVETTVWLLLQNLMVLCFDLYILVLVL